MNVDLNLVEKLVQKVMEQVEGKFLLDIQSRR